MRFSKTPNCFRWPIAVVRTTHCFAPLRRPVPSPGGVCLQHPRDVLRGHHPHALILQRRGCSSLAPSASPPLAGAVSASPTTVTRHPATKFDQQLPSGTITFDEGGAPHLSIRVPTNNSNDPLWQRSEHDEPPTFATAAGQQAAFTPLPSDEELIQMIEARLARSPIRTMEGVNEAAPTGDPHGRHFDAPFIQEGYSGDKAAEHCALRAHLATLIHNPIPMGYYRTASAALPMANSQQTQAQSPAAESTPNVSESSDGTNGAPPPLTAKQLRRLFLRASLPFFGFGLCDNLIMITVGDAIDATFGVTLGFSTMVAAGFGQAVSDGAGISIQGAIENASDRMGLPSTEITPAQEAMASTRWWTQAFRTIGIVSGCLVGVLFALLFDGGNRPRLLDSLFRTLPEETRRDLMSKQTVRTFAEGDRILNYGEEAGGLFIIATGLVDIVGRDDAGDPMHIHVNKPGDCVGAVELTFGHKCVADVVVSSPSLRAVFISKDDFMAAVDPEKDPERFGRVKEDMRRFLGEDDEYVAYRIRYLSRSANTAAAAAAA